MTLYIQKCSTYTVMQTTYSDGLIIMSYKTTNSCGLLKPQAVIVASCRIAAPVQGSISRECHCIVCITAFHRQVSLCVGTDCMLG